MNPWIVDHLWLVPAVPLGASLLILGFARKRPTAAARLATIGQLVTLVLAAIAFLPTLQNPLAGVP